MFGLARSTFYYHLKRSNVDKYVHEKQKIVQIFNENKARYGYRRITIVMKNEGFKINHKTVLKLMKTLGLEGKKRKNNKYRSYKGEVGKIADDLLKRNFKANAPFEKIVTDITQFNVCDKKVYISPVLDLFNREIIAYSSSMSPNLKQVKRMLRSLFKKLPAGKTPIFHSDQGWQYQHIDYQKMLAKVHIKQSMSRKGNCLNNGAMENFFGRFKVEMFYGEKFKNVNHFICKLRKYIFYYNNKRISSNLKGMRPELYRTHFRKI